MRVLLAAVAAWGVLSPLHADEILFESGALGSTGITVNQVAAEEVGGSGVTANVFSGVRFSLDEPVLTSSIGGHFLGASAGGSFFGAIVELSDQDDFPDSTDLSTPDVLGTTLLEFPAVSDEVFGDLELSLDPGDYALVFGSGLFEANGSGVAVLNNPDIDNPEYFLFEPNVGFIDLVGSFSEFDDYRMLVIGRVVPEPTSLVCSILFAVAICSMSQRQIC